MRTDPARRTLCWVYLSPAAMARGVRIVVATPHATAPKPARKWWRRKGR